MTTPQSHQPATVAPPDFEELLQASLKAPFSPKEVFGNLRNLPVPSYARMLANILLWSVAAFALHVLFKGSQSPFTQGGAIAMFLRLIATLMALAVFSFVGAGVLHLLALLSGGRENYARSFQILSLLSLMTPLAALVQPFPGLNMVPTAYGIYLAIRAVSLMHGAPILQAGIVFGLAGLLTIAGQWLSNRQIERWQRGMQAQIEIAQTTTQETPLQQAQQLLQMANQMVQQSDPPVSGLDLVKRESGDEPAEETSLRGSPEIETQPTPGQLPDAEQMKKMQQTGFKMLQGIQQAAADPKFFDRMNPQQASTMRKILQMSERISTLYQQRSASGTKAAKLTDAEAQQMFQQIQTLMQTLKQQEPPLNPSNSRP